jgi:DDE family transposase
LWKRIEPLLPVAKPYSGRSSIAKQQALTGANVHDAPQAILLIDAIPGIKQPRGGRHRRPDKVVGDRAYDAQAKVRPALRDRGIQPLIAKHNTEHGSGLGKHRGIVEGVFAWLFKQHLSVRFEKRDDTLHFSFSAACLFAGTEFKGFVGVPEKSLLSSWSW